MPRHIVRTIETDLGIEWLCLRCLELWPGDTEFYYQCKGKPFSWCRACYLEAPSVKKRNERKNANRKTNKSAVHCTAPLT